MSSSSSTFHNTSKCSRSLSSFVALGTRDLPDSFIGVAPVVKFESTTEGPWTRKTFIDVKLRAVARNGATDEKTMRGLCKRLDELRDVIGDKVQQCAPSYNSNANECSLDRKTVEMRICEDLLESASSFDEGSSSSACGSRHIRVMLEDDLAALSGTAKGDSTAMVARVN